MITTYKTIANISQAEFRDRGSKFLAFAYPVQSIEEIKSILKTIKAEHPKAVHCCYAYRLGFDQTQFRANDDGEPSGSAGKPILGQLDSARVTHVLVAVVRYFGGVLLGVPGLINAYKTAAQEALQANEIIEKEIMQNLPCEFDYTLMNEVMRVVKQYEGKIIGQEMLLFASLQIQSATSFVYLPASKPYKKFMG
jgi:uncharacterized YigZ family protein